MHPTLYRQIRPNRREADRGGPRPLDQHRVKGTLGTARQYSRTLAQIPVSNRKLRRQLYADMLAVIAEDLVPERPDRFEPRCQKRRPKSYPFMSQPRSVLKAARKDFLPSRKKVASLT